jgi:hypothetical protein
LLQEHIQGGRHKIRTNDTIKKERRKRKIELRKDKKNSRHATEEENFFWIATNNNWN